MASKKLRDLFDLLQEAEERVLEQEQIVESIVNDLTVQIYELKLRRTEFITANANYIVSLEEK